MKKRSLVLLLAWVATVAAVRAGVPSPAEVFGFSPGEDYKLADYSMMREYYRRLDAASDRIRVVEIGPTAEDRPMILAVISSEENMARLEEYRGTAERLARARISEEEAVQLAGAGRAVIWIDGGLHATEVAHAQHSPELAYRLVSGESEEIRRIRRDVILLQVPVMNPDGLEMVVRWYKHNLGTPFETSPLPWLYQKYVGHDNNRDWYMITQRETQNVSRLLYRRWYPQIVYNHHQTAPFPARIFIPPFAAPMNPNIPPQVLRGIDLVGSAMSARFEAEGKAGVISRLGFTTWWNGGMRTVPYYHNMVGILTETALYHYATPHEYPPKSLPRTFRGGLSTRKPSPDYPHPWRGGLWRLGDAVQYMLTASMAVLDVGSRYRDRWLMGIYRMGRQAIERGRQGKPFAWVVRPTQWDPGAARELVATLLRGGVEIERAREEFQAGGESYPPGTYVVPAAQPFRAYLMDLMERQDYPERRRYPGGPPLRPYDITGWTLPIQMGVGVDRIEEPFEFRSSPVERLPAEEGPLPRARVGYWIDRRWNLSFRLINRLLERGIAVEFSPAPVETGGEEWPAGTFFVPASAAAELAQLDSGLAPALRPAAGTSRLERLRAPRLGLYRSWVPNSDEGWTRWLLEQYGFPYRRLTNREILTTPLRENYDVILLPSQSPEVMLSGRPPGSMPEEFTGGLGLEGFTRLKQFVEQGGILVALDQAALVPVRYFDIPVHDVLQGVAATVFACPGSLLGLEVDPGDPLTWGMPPRTAGMFINSLALEAGYRGLGRRQTEEPQSSPKGVWMPVHYARDSLLRSGWILGGERIRGKGAALRVALGRGQVVLLGFRSQFRGQPHATFKLLFNALYLGGMSR